MFKFIKNLNEWVTPELMTQLATKSGDKTPVWQPDRWKGHPLLDQFREEARPFFEKETPYFQQFGPNTVDMQGYDFNMPDLIPHLPEKRKHCIAWFIKLLPGQMQTMHIDPHLIDMVKRESNPVRYSMFLQDYVPGHVFVYDDFLATNYKAGDIFEWNDPDCVHACVNVSYTVRYTLQITLHD